jgi:hypothetical protein
MFFIPDPTGAESTTLQLDVLWRARLLVGLGKPSRRLKGTQD